jgi:hypothetical protein
MKTASAQARDRWRLTSLATSAHAQSEMTGASGTHALGTAARVGEGSPAPHIVAPPVAESDSALQLAVRLEHSERVSERLRAERDVLSSRLEQALSDISRLEGIVHSLRPQPPAPAVAPPALPLAAPPLPVAAPPLPVIAPLPTCSLSGVSLDTGTGRQLHVAFLHDTHLICDFDRDISEGGIFVATYETLELGARVELCFELGEHLLLAHGTVRWSLPAHEEAEQRPGYAIFFEQLSAEAADALRGYCRVHPPHYYEV